MSLIIKINSLLSSILNTRLGNLFYHFSNADGKTWLMPAMNMRTAMNLYQPSEWKGKMIKTLFPWLYRISMVRKFIHAETVRCSMSDELKQLCCRLFHETAMEFSIFCGTPGVHQKITMQLSKGNRIMGYCKVTDSDEIAALFQSEVNVLKELGRKGFKDIPTCLFYGELKNGVRVFVQSTVKTRQSQVIHEWTVLHDNFLNKLYQHTHRLVEFEKSDYYHTLSVLQQHIDWLPPETDSSFITAVINRIQSRWQGQKVDFSAYHADFTPWNMFVEKRLLFVFDWEYARMSYPPMLDLYHFFTQTAIFEKHWQADRIIAFLLSNEDKWIDKETYTLYLLDIIARFTIREKGNVKGDIAHSMKIWNDLLKSLNP